MFCFFFFVHYNNGDFMRRILFFFLLFLFFIGVKANSYLLNDIRFYRVISENRAKTSRLTIWHGRHLYS